MVEATVDETVFVLINIYNANTESEQLETLLDLVSIIDKVKDIQSKNIVLGGDFNVIFDISLESLGGNPCLKKKSIAKLIQIKEKFDIRNIWRIRNPKIKRFTFRQQHISGFIQRRIDYFFLSNLLQESVNKTDILAAFSTDHSPLLFSLKLRTDENRGKELWKFNNSLSMNSDFQTKMKFHIKSTLETLEIEAINDHQVRWEFLKYEIRKFSIEFSKLQAQNTKKEKMFLENKLKKLEINTNCMENLEYIDCRNKLDKIYEQKINGIRIRSKCDWYEHGEKSSKFFLNLEKTRSTQSTIRNITKDKKNLTFHKKINQELFDFYKGLFSENLNVSKNEIMQFLNLVSIPQLTEDQSKDCEFILSEKDLLLVLKSMPNNKSPGNDGLTKEFYEVFWDDLKTPLLSSFKSAFVKGELSISQKQAVIKLIEKKDKDKRLIQNWRPISLLNIDLKILSKALANRIKKYLPFLISSNQTAYVEGRFIGEGGRLFSDILQVTDFLNIRGLVVTVDIQKAFDSVNQLFLITALKKFGFVKEFIKWIQILLKNQESCIINGGTTTKYFKLQKGTRQGDPISAYLFILVLEIAFIFIKENKNIKGTNIFGNIFLYSAYADDTTFFLSDEDSVIEVINAFHKFSLVSGLKPNEAKCEIAGIGVLKGVSLALCDMDSLT